MTNSGNSGIGGGWVNVPQGPASGYYTASSIPFTATYLIIVFPFGTPHGTSPIQIFNKGEMYTVDADSESDAIYKMRQLVGDRPMFAMRGMSV